MPDDPNKRDFRDRDRVAGEEDYEVQYFADQSGISIDQVRELIKRFGNDRVVLEREVAKMKA